MTEYIYDTAKVDTLSTQGFTGEEIVRCRDCRCYMDYEHEYEPNLGYCREHDREEVHSMRFCAWGERREK